jgi:hypothetical protein
VTHNPFGARGGHGWWRGLHLAMGIGVLVFTAVHALLEGSHFTELKEQAPGWLARMNLG